MRVTLVYPPDVLLPTVPYASLAVLTSCLEKAGHEVTVRDLNLEMFYALMREDRLRHYRGVVDGLRAELEGRERLDEADAQNLWQLQNLLSVPDSVFSEVADSIEVMTDKELFFEPRRFNRAFDVLRASLRFMHNVCPPPTESVHHSIETVRWFFESERPDPVIEVFREGMLESLLADEPDVIAMTLPFDPAIFHCLKLCRLLKEAAPEVPIILGGAGIDSNAFHLMKDAALFELYDYAMNGEGDTAFPEFLAALEEGRDVSEVPNLTWRGADGELRTNPLEQVKNLNELPSPDFSKVPLDRYLLPYPVATFLTSRGCYYGRCTFCSELFRKNYRMRHEKVVIEDLQEVHDKTGIRFFQFWDSLAPPRTLHHVSRKIAERGLELYWMAETKFEKQYSWEDYMSTLAEGGCRFLQFGFESAVSRVLDLMDKGNDLEVVDVILGQMERFGVQGGVTWFIGFPTETAEEADRTYDFIASREVIKYSSFTGTFGLGDDMIAYEDPDALGIEIFRKENGELDFRNKDGTPHYDRTEHTVMFSSRSDLNLIQNNIELLYATYAPDRHIELSGRKRLGPYLRHVDPARHGEIRFERCPEAYVTAFARHPFRDGVEGREPIVYAYQIMSGHTYELGRESRALWDALGGPSSLAELAQRTGLAPEATLALVEQAVNRGLVKILCPEDAIRYREGEGARRALQSLVSD